jgi:hypothetical protein
VRGNSTLPTGGLVFTVFSLARIRQVSLIVTTLKGWSARCDDERSFLKENMTGPIRKQRNEARNAKRRLQRAGITPPLQPTMGLYPSEIAQATFTADQELKVHEILIKAMARAQRPHLKPCMLMKRAIMQGARELAAMRKLLAIYTN